MSNQVLPVNDTNFDAEVTRSPLPVLVDFTATWCGPCKQIAPLVAQVAAQTPGLAKVVKVDIDQAPKTAAKFAIKGVPTILVMRGGREVMRHVGANINAQRLRAMLGV